MLSRLADGLVEGMGWLDPVGKFLQKLVGSLFKALGPAGTPLKSFLHGTWLGHALHPLLTDVPLGAWTVAVVADLAFLTGHLSRSVGDFAVFIGLLGGLAAAVSGYTDFHETFGHERRTATLHGLVNTIALVLYAVSWLLRWRSGDSSHTTAVALAMVGYVLVAGSAYLGGHLAFGFGTMVNRNAFTEGPTKNFVPIAASVDIPEGRAARVDAKGAAVLVTRAGGRLCGIGAVCSHAGGPLEEGQIEAGVVTCPWHGSRFNLCTGAVRQGPATFAQPRYAVREDDGTMQVKLEEQVHG